MNERLFLLENEKIIKLIYKFSLPSIIGLLITASYTIIDRIFIGNGVGVLALSGVTIIFPIIMIGMAFSMLVGIGSTALVSIRLGEKKINEAEQILGNAISISIIISIFLIIFCYLFIDEILYIFGADKEVFSYAKEFLIFFLPGTIFQLLLFTLNNIIRGEGNPKTAMYTMFLSSIVNIILNPLFIFVFKLGVKGSAIATVISQFISCTWVLLYFYSNKSILKIRIHNLKLKFKVTRDIFSIGMASFAMHIVGSIVIMIFNSKLKIYGGDLAVASLGIINSIVTLFLMPIFGINQGIQPILGYNYGAKRFNRIQETLKSSMIIATIICIIGFSIIFLSSNIIVGLFSKNDENLIYIGSHGLKLFTLMFPFVGFQIVAAGYFQAIGKAKHSLFFSMLRQAIVLIPLLFFLPSYFYLDGIWLAGSFSDGIAALIMCLFIFYEWKNLEVQKRINSHNLTLQNATLSDS